MAWFLQLTGCFIIINYSTLVFFKSNDMMNSHIASIILGGVQVFGGILSSFASDTIGRKVLLIISLLGSALGLLAQSIYSYLDHIGYDLSHYWSLPVVFLSFVIFTSCIGIAPLSNVCTVENLPPKVNKILIIITIAFHFLTLFLLINFSLFSQIRTSGMVLYTLWYNIVAFLGDKYFPILLKMIHLHGCLSIFAVNCFLGILFVIFLMKETKGRSI